MPEGTSGASGVARRTYQKPSYADIEFPTLVFCAFGEFAYIWKNF